MTNPVRSSRFWGSHQCFIFALWSIFFCWGAPALATTGDGSLTDSNITYVGRWDKSNSSTYTSYWGGAYLTTKFTGTSVQLKLGPKATKLKVSIDGNVTTYWQGSGTVNLTPWPPLASGTHTLKVMIDWQDNELAFQGLILDAGASTVAPEVRPLVEFIGDSITAGHVTSETALTSYAWLTGERLGAEHTQIAYPSITLADGFHYSYNTFPGMDSLYFKLRPANRCLDVACADNPAWNFANYTAKLVVINLGTNDAFVGVRADIFQSRYITFLQNIRVKYPNAEIFALRTFGNHYVTETQAAVNARVSAGDTKVHFIDTSGWLDAATDFGPTDAVHPIDSGHVKVTNRLLPILQPYMVGGTTTANDTQFNYDSAANWPYGGQTGAYQGDNHWSNLVNAYYQVSFSGTQVALYGGRAPWHGIAAVSIDGGAETPVDTYAATRADGVLLWNSPMLGAGLHTLKVRVTGLKNVNATGSYITADRVDIAKGGVNLLNNPGFENGLSGWSVWPAGAPQAYAQAWRANSGTTHLVHWSATPYQVNTYQTLTGLSNGLYTAKAWVRASGGQEMYVKDYGGAQMTAYLPATTSDAYRELVISNINVTNGNAQIGFWTNDAQGNRWIDADDVAFYKQ